MNKFDLMRDSINDAETTMKAAEQMAVDIAALLVGRLRDVNNGEYHPRIGDYRRTEILKALKRELQDFNANTGRWK